MAIEHRPESDFPYWVVRNDGAIVCACASEDAAERVNDAAFRLTVPPKVAAYLGEAGTPGAGILIKGDGPLYTIQAGGHACEQPETTASEIIPLNDYDRGLLESLVAFGVWSPWVCPSVDTFTDTNADHIDRIMAPRGWETDRTMLSASMESWVHIRSMDGERRKGILYWGNSD